MAHIPGLYLKPESFSPSYGRKKMTDTQEALFPESAKNVRCMLERLDADGFTDFDG